ncbi:hypothetical protein D1872_288720 [compost metagenome]
MGAIREHHGHPVPFDDPEAQQRPGKAVTLFQQTGVSRFFTEKIKRASFRIRFGGLHKKLGQILLRISVGRWYFGGIMS